MISPAEQGTGPYGCAFYKDATNTMLKLVEESEGDCAQYCTLAFPDVQTILGNEGFSSNGLVFGADAAEVMNYLPLMDILPCMQDATACPVQDPPWFICRCHALLWRQFHDPTYFGVSVLLVVNLLYRFAPDCISIDVFHCKWLNVLCV